MTRRLCEPGTGSQTQQLTQMVCDGFHFALVGDPQPFKVARLIRKQPLVLPVPLRLLSKGPLSEFLFLPTQGG